MQIQVEVNESNEQCVNTHNADLDHINTLVTFLTKTLFNQGSKLNVFTYFRFFAQAIFKMYTDWKVNNVLNLKNRLLKVIIN